MVKQRFLLGGLLSLAALMAGCGGGGGETASASVPTGTGYYVDSPVAGVDFVCGTQQGITDNEGKFVFEIGQGCRFEIAGLTIREVGADILGEDATILEDNVTVATFLQALDADGNPANGITIKPEVVKKLEAIGLATVPTDANPEANLSTIVTTLRYEVEGFEGEVPSREEVEEHIAGTASELVKKAMAGKTFYGVEERENGGYALVEYRFNDDLTLLEWRDIAGTNYSGSDEIELNGNVFHLYGGDDNDDVYIRATAFTNDYVVVQDITLVNSVIIGNESKKIYRKLEDARAEYDRLTGNVYALLAGKTFYAVGYGTEEDGTAYFDLGEVDFNSAMSTLTYTAIEPSEDDGGSFSITLEGNKIIWNDDKNYSIVGKDNGDYIEFIDYDSDGRFEGIHRLYREREKAEAYYNELSANDSLRNFDYSFIGDFMNSEECMRGMPGDSVALAGKGGSVHGWHDGDYPLQMLIVMNAQKTKVICMKYDFHYYDGGDLDGLGQSGTLEDNQAEVDADHLVISTSYSFTFDGTIDASGRYSGTWRQEASSINGEYSGSGAFEIVLQTIQ